MSDETPDRYTDGYNECIKTLTLAGQAWIKQHPFAEPKFRDFEQVVAEKMGRKPGKMAIIAQLGDIIDDWADNEDARAFLRHLDAATDGKATYLQVRGIMQMALEHAIEKNQGLMPEGDWRCPTCSTPNDRFTHVNPAKGAEGVYVPKPGTVGVCFYCAALNLVNADGNGFLTLLDTEFNQMPTSFRKRLREMQRVVRAAKREEERQS